MILSIGRIVHVVHSNKCWAAIVVEKDTPAPGERSGWFVFMFGGTRDRDDMTWLPDAQIPEDTLKWHEPRECVDAASDARCPYITSDGHQCTGMVGHGPHHQAANGTYWIA